MLLRAKDQLRLFIMCLCGAAFGMTAGRAGVLSWGQDDQGQLGLNRSLFTAEPVIINDTGALAGKQVTRVVDGTDHALALTSDGLLYAWGDNEDGQLGTGNTRAENVPTAIPMTAFAGKTVVGIAAGLDLSLAWTADGAVFAWGRSGDGQCGVFTDRVLTPRLIDTGALAGRAVKKVVAGSHFALAITTNGELVGWGGNSSGQLGDGTTTDTELPILISTATALVGLEITEVAAGNFFSLAVAADGRVFSWGFGYFDGLGRTGSALIPAPVNMSGVLAGKKVTKVSAGYAHAIALTEDGLLYAWGDNSSYTYLGDYTLTTSESSVPRALRMEEFGSRQIVQIVAGQNHNLALADDGTLYGWGFNSRGYLGNGDNMGMKVPVEALPVGARQGRTLSRLSEDVNGRCTHALTADGKLLGWGQDERGQVGRGNQVWRTEPVDMMTGMVEGPANVAATSRGPVFLSSAWWLVILSSAQATNATTTNRLISIDNEQSDLVAAGFDHLLIVKQDGTLSGYGTNLYGQIGDGTTNTTFNLRPVVTTGVLAGKSYSQIAAGAYFSLVLTTDGGLYAWGQNNLGQLGIGGTSNTSLPVAVDVSEALAGKVPVAIAAGNDHVLCATSDGRLYAWGANDHGQLGDGTTTSRLRAVEIPRTGEFAGSSITKVWAGSTHSFALASDGTLFGWGNNDHGQLGADTFTASALSPVPVFVDGEMEGKTVQKVTAGRDFTLILCTDGTVYGMGDNRYGSLGTGDRVDRAQPTALTASPLLNNRVITDIAAGKSGYGVTAVTTVTSGPDFRLSASRYLQGSGSEVEAFSDGRHQLGDNGVYARANQLSVSNRTSSPLSLSNVTFTGPDAAYFRLTSPIPATLLAGQSAEFTINTTDPPWPLPNRTGALRFETNDPAYPVYELPITFRAYYPASFTTPVEATTILSVSQGFPIELSPQVLYPVSRYEWTRNGSPTVISSRSSLQIANATPAHSGTYKISVPNYVGAPSSQYQSRTFIVSVLQTPVITTQPQSITVPAGGTAEFSVAATSTVGDISYQWLHAGEPIPGATTATFSRPLVLPHMAGEYEVRLTNSAGGVNSRQVTLTVSLGIPLQSGSFSDIAFAGEPVALASGAYGVTPLSIQWKKAGKSIPGATGLTYSPTAKMSAAAMGSYTFTMANALAPTPVSSTPGWLGMMTRAPATAYVVNGRAISLTCIASSPVGTSLSYEWRKDGQSLIGFPLASGLTTKTLKITSATPSHAGAYTCHVSMTTPQGTITRPNSATTLTVIEVPSLDPASTVLPVVRVGQTITHQLIGLKNPVSYTATGLPPGITLNRSTGILTGRFTTALFLKGVNAPYKVRLTTTNTAGSSTTQEIDWLVLPLEALTVGQFHGLVDRVAAINGLAGSETGLGGSLVLTVSSSASCTGTLTSGAEKHSLSGLWTLASTTAAPVFNLTIIRKSPLANLVLDFTIDPLTGKLTGSIQAGSEQAAVTAWRLTPNAALAGWWNAVLQSGGAPLSSRPSGAGMTSVKLVTTGQAQWSGRLADGTTITHASGIGPAGELPLHLLLHSGKGSLQGWTQIGADDASWTSTLGWWKATDAGGANYPAGFPIHNLYMTGEKYLRPTSGNLLGYPEGSGNAQVRLSAGSLITPLTQTFTLTTIQMASMPANANAMTFTLTPSTGWFSGSFKSTDAPSRAGTFHGIMLPGLQTGLGFFLQAMPASADPAKPVKSGLVEVLRK
jgi:alpha-tubulin suppressor-like RCC1 family protein